MRLCPADDDVYDMSLRRRPCPSCGTPIRLDHAVRLCGRTYCGRDCARQIQAARVKVFHDLRDSSPTVCRCSGPPVPLEPTGPHCAGCRRMFSAGMRIWLLSRERNHQRWRFPALARWVEELLAQLGRDGLRA
jgi:hypothetical protein